MKKVWLVYRAAMWEEKPTLLHVCASREIAEGCKQLLSKNPLIFIDIEETVLQTRKPKG